MENQKQIEKNHKTFYYSSARATIQEHCFNSLDLGKFQKLEEIAPLKRQYDQCMKTAYEAFDDFLNIK